MRGIAPSRCHLTGVTACVHGSLTRASHGPAWIRERAARQAVGVFDRLRPRGWHARCSSGPADIVRGSPLATRGGWGPGGGSGTRPEDTRTRAPPSVRVPPGTLAAHGIASPKSNDPALGPHERSGERDASPPPLGARRGDAGGARAPRARTRTSSTPRTAAPSGARAGPDRTPREGPSHRESRSPRRDSGASEVVRSNAVKNRIRPVNEAGDVRGSSRSPRASSGEGSRSRVRSTTGCLLACTSRRSRSHDTFTSHASDRMIRMRAKHASRMRPARIRHAARVRHARTAHASRMRRARVTHAPRTLHSRTTHAPHPRRARAARVRHARFTRASHVLPALAPHSPRAAEHCAHRRSPARMRPSHPLLMGVARERESV